MHSRAFCDFVDDFLIFPQRQPHHFGVVWAALRKHGPVVDVVAGGKHLFDIESVRDFSLERAAVDGSESLPVGRQHNDRLDAQAAVNISCGVAVRLASERPVGRLILVTPYDSILAIASARYPYLPVRLLLLDRYESWRYAPQVRAPTTILAAEHDEVIPRASTARLLQRFAPGVASLRSIAGVGHNDLDASADYLAMLRAASH